MYMQFRKFIPDQWLKRLRQQRLLLRLARHLQPQDMEIMKLHSPLNGHQMRLPQAWTYTMTWGQYEPECCAIIEKFVLPGMHVIDVGAHIGYLTLLARQQVGDAGEVICFEPLPENRIILHENLKLNNYLQNTRIEPMAVADTISLMPLYLTSSSSESRLFKTDQNKKIVVSVCTLDAYLEMLEWPNVDFIKMDIEGAESLAIQGMKETITRFHPTFLIEAHGDVAQEGLDYLCNNGYLLTRFVTPEKTLKYEPGVEISGHWLAQYSADQ